MKYGLTLIEWVIICAIAALLVALVLPPIVSARKTHQQKQLVTNSLPVPSPSSLRAEDFEAKPAGMRISLSWYQSNFSKPDLYLYHDSNSGADVLVIDTAHGTTAVVLPGR